MTHEQEIKQTQVKPETNMSVIKNSRELRKAVRKLTDMNGLDRVAIFFRGSVWMPHAFECEVRAIQVLVNKGELSEKDVHIVEYYDTLEGRVEHTIHLLPNGVLAEPFHTSFMSKNDDLALMVMF